jgi:hypothetical protein
MVFKGKYGVPVMLFLAVILLLVLMFSFTPVTPYSRDNLFRSYSSGYEAFAEGADGAETEEPKEGGNVVVDENSVPVSENAEPQNPLTAPDKKKEQPKKESFEPMTSSSKLDFSSYNGGEILDKFSALGNEPVNGSCVSAGLSNSKGPLCLTPELIHDLKSRGNNM